MMVCQGRLALSRSEKVGWYQLRALVEKLKECVLTIGARLTPDDRAGA